jgi:hypothetical protein
MLFFLNLHFFFLRSFTHILLLLTLLAIAGCSGSRKYFKAAERLEKQGLTGDAAEYYLESLQRKPTNVKARIKLKEVGQKHISGLASEFFRNYSTEQTEASLESFEKLKSFYDRSAALQVQFDYPKSYEEDYRKAVETFCTKKYSQAVVLVSQKKYAQALPFIYAIKKYNATYKNIPQLELVSVCEPLYQSAINSLENKNYSSALGFLSGISQKTENYKDSRDLLELASNQQSKSFILFQPKPSGDPSLKVIDEYLYNNFSQAALQKLSSVKIINNTPFQNAPGSTDLSNSENVDLIQAIRKATGADYFYVYNVSNKRESSPGLSKTPSKGYLEIKTRKNDTLVITEYKTFDYTVVKGQRAYSYDFNFKIINAYSNQIVSSQTQNVVSQDAVEYQEFARNFKGDINSLYPYNPALTAPMAKYNPRNWRAGFSARNSLKTFEELKNEAHNKTINLFVGSAGAMK